MIPTSRPTGRLVDLPNGPQLLAATLWNDRTGPDALRDQIATWKQELMRPVRDVTVALEAIAWAERLPLLADFLGPEDCRALGEFLAGLPADVDQQTLEEQPLVHQLLAGELAWILTARSPEAQFAARLESSGRSALSNGLTQILDQQGMLSAEHFPLLRPLLACWVRCRVLAAKMLHGGFRPRAEQRYLRFVRNTVRCTRPDGRPLFAENHGPSRPTGSWGRELYDAVLKCGLEEIDRRLVATALPPLSLGTGAKAPKKTADLPPPSIYWEQGSIAVMRRDWNRDEERLAVRFAGKACELELVSSGRVAISGTWQFGVSQQGQPLQPVSNWEESCWYTDKEIDYLELEIELTTSVKLQRHIVLAREDRFALLADAVMSPHQGALDYRGVLPLGQQVEFCGAAESREGLLAQGRPATAGKAIASSRPLAHVLPLALPEWRTERCGGELKGVAEGLELQQSSAKQRLFAPLFIDLDRSRFRRRMTWRQLTVAESLEPVPPETAVGYRIAIGDQQWLLYRSLAARNNRTILGHNLATESLIARFGKDGEVTSIVEIE